MTSSYDQMVSFSKENVDALVKSGTATVKGFEELTKYYTTLANASVEQSSSAVKALAAAKSPVEFQSIYSSIATDSFNSFVAESKKVQEMTGALMTEAFAPLGARMQAFTGFFKYAA